MSKLTSLSLTEELLFGNNYTDIQDPHHLRPELTRAIDNRGVWACVDYRLEVYHPQGDYVEIVIKAKGPAHPSPGSAQSINDCLQQYRFRGQLLRMSTFCESRITRDLVAGVPHLDYTEIVFRVKAQAPNAPLKAPQRSPGWTNGVPGMKPRLF